MPRRHGLLRPAAWTLLLAGTWALFNTSSVGRRAGYWGLVEATSLGSPFGGLLQGLTRAFSPWPTGTVLVLALATAMLQRRSDGVRCVLEGGVLLGLAWVR